MTLVRVRSLLLAFFCLFYVGTWPGAALRPRALEPLLVALPVPETLGDRDGVLTVRVTGADQVALSGIRVRAFALLEGRAHDAGDTTTDTQGHATLTRLPHAEHWIVAEAAGHARASQMVVITTGPRTLDLELADEHVLDVVVNGDQGAGVPFAEIEVRGSDPFPVGARTDATGHARVVRLGEGRYDVTARAPGFEEATRRRVPEGLPCVVTLGRQGALRVKVLAESGAPVPGARVLVASPSLWPARASETEADGSIRIGHLDPGSYTLRAMHDTRVSPIEFDVSVGRGEEKLVELRLAQGMMVSVDVVDAASREGIARARVTLAESGLSPFPMEGLTDPRGHAQLGPIAHGAASVAAHADGFVALGALRVEDPPPARITLALLKGGRLLGTIVDTRGYPVDGATIRVVGTDLEGLPIDEDPERRSFSESHFTASLDGPKPLVPSGELGVMPGPVAGIPQGLWEGFVPKTTAQVRAEKAAPWVSGRDGTFVAEPVPPGRVRALVHHPQYVEAMSDLVTLLPDSDARVSLVLSRGGTLVGRVVDSRGTRVSGAHVTVLATRGSLERVTRSGTDGSFAFASLPATLTVFVSRDQDAAQAAVRVEVTVAEGLTKTVEIAIPEERSPLNVTVKSERGRPMVGAQVSAVSLEPSYALRVTAFTNDRGEAELTNAKGVALRVEVRAAGRASKSVVTTPETESLTVALAPSETLTGEVWANRRVAIEGAEVTLQTEMATRHGVTNKQGIYTFVDLAPGLGRLRIRAKGRAAFSRDVTVEDRGGVRPTEVPSVELREEGVVEGVVQGASGEPIPGARVARDAVPTYVAAATTVPPSMAVTDAKGRFRLGELAEGALTLEAYSPDFGRGRVVGVRVRAGRTTDGVTVTLTRRESQGAEPLTTGGVAVTLGETAAGLEAAEVVLVAVAEASEAERAGLLANDVLFEVDRVRVRTIADARARLAGSVRDDVVVTVKRGDKRVVLRVTREQVRR